LEQSKYNPVKRDTMVTLSKKLARIILLINHFGKHLNSQSNIINSKLAAQNFQHAGIVIFGIMIIDAT
jgi:hypothetical protein